MVPKKPDQLLAGRVDETYTRVKGQWKYLYRGDLDRRRVLMLYFYLSDQRNAKAAKRFLAKALRRSRDWTPRVINTDKNPAYGEAIAESEEGRPAAERDPDTGR